MRIVVAVLAAVVLSSSRGNCSDELELANPPEMVSLVRLIATPDEFDGEMVVTVGVPHFEGDGDALCISVEAASRPILPNCILLDLSQAKHPIPRESLIEHEGAYLLLEGKFEGRREDRFGSELPALASISRAVLYSE